MSKKKQNEKLPTKTYFSIEKVSQQKHQLIEIVISSENVEIKILREDIPEIVRAKFMEALWNSPFKGERK